MLKKFAIAGEVIGEPHLAHALSGLLKNAHRAVFDYTPKMGFLYVRSRMISSRCNDNFDEFPAEEIASGYLSFIGKPVFVNHHNDNHRRMRGVIIDAVLHKDANPDGSKDWWVEGLMEVDAIRFPKLAKAIVRGDIQRTSMGVDVKYSLCSICGRKATTPAEYCNHIPRSKGQTVWKAEASTGRRRGELVREICHGLSFFENSLLVEAPADPTAFFLGSVEMGPGLEHLSAHTATLQVPLPRWPHAPAEVPVGLQRHASRTINAPKPNHLKDRLSEVSLGKDDKGFFVYTHRARSDSRGTPEEIPQKDIDFIASTGGLMLVQGSHCTACSGLNTVAHRSTGDSECIDCAHHWNPRTAGLQVEAAPKHQDPADHPFFQKNPVHHDNILAHWNAATDDEREQGRRWYADAHLVSKALGEKYLPDHPHGPANAAAGIVAAYSPQQGWAGNLHNAARVMHEGKGIGGPGSGMFASAHQKRTADKIIAGAHYDDVLGGPKIKDFAHLIEHGKDKDPEAPRTVVDRHALSVATGKRMSTDDYGEFPKDNRHYYGHVVDQYNKAASRISEQEIKAGREPVAAHQVQAATWLTRQRFNQQAEEEHAKAGGDSRLNRGRAKARTNAEDQWDNWRNENAPDIHGGPGTGYVKPQKEGGRSLRGTGFPRR